MFRPTHLCTVLAAVLCACALPSFAQTTEGEILARLKGKPLILRGCWGEDHLAFDATGKPVRAYRAVSFTLAGADVYHVKLKADGLELSAVRMGLEFKNGLQPRRVELSWPGYEGQIRLLIAGHKGEDFGPALDAIFAPNLPAMLPALSEPWELVRKQVLEGSTASLSKGMTVLTSPLTETSRSDSGGHYTAEEARRMERPVLILEKPSQFSEAARALGYERPVEVYLWINTDGLPSHLRVVKPAGLGLDEEALAGVSGFRFKPAQLDGKPVGVDLYVQVNFVRRNY